MRSTNTPLYTRGPSIKPHGNDVVENSLNQTRQISKYVSQCAFNSGPVGRIEYVFDIRWQNDTAAIRIQFNLFQMSGAGHLRRFLQPFQYRSVSPILRVYIGAVLNSSICFYESLLLSGPSCLCSSWRSSLPGFPLAFSESLLTPKHAISKLAISFFHQQLGCLLRNNSFLGIV